MVSVEAKSQGYYIHVLNTAERILQDSGVDHRFLGGAVTNPVSLVTKVGIDTRQKKAVYQDIKPMSLVRHDGSIRDIDVIGFSANPDTYTEARRRFHEEAILAHKQGLPYPPISIEPISYLPPSFKQKLLQFVSTIYVNSDGRLNLSFGEVNQVIPDETLAAWHITFPGGLELTSINPYGIPKRYAMRNASGLKRKDKAIEEIRDGIAYSKIDILTLIANSVTEQGLAQGVNYPAMYKSWEDFIYNLQNHPDWLTAKKAAITKWYWDTIGTALAHGRGIFKPFASLGDSFTGGK